MTEIWLNKKKNKVQIKEKSIKHKHKELKA